VPRQPIGQGLLHIQSDLADPTAEPEFTRWCNEVHHATVLQLPGFLSLRRYERVPGYRYAAPDGTRFLTVYQVATPAAVDSPHHREHLRTDVALPERVAAVLTFLRTIYGQCFPDTGSLTPSGVEPGPEQGIGTAVLHVMMDVEPAWELEFNAWYNEEHLISLLAVPGFISARRFADVQWPADGNQSADGRHQYLAMYELEDLAVVESAAYARACELTTWTEKLAPHLSFHSQIYRQVFPAEGTFTI
jgi:hypothetical protein